MPHVFDFEQFENDFRRACVLGVRYLADHYNKDPFYAVSVYADEFGGCFALYANTEMEFKKTLAVSQATYPDSYETSADIIAEKFDCGNWLYQSVGAPPEDFYKVVSNFMERWHKEVYDVTYHQSAFSSRNYRAFMEAACRVAMSDELANEMMRLNRTSDFMVTVSDHDGSSLSSLDRIPYYREHGSLDGFPG